MESISTTHFHAVLRNVRFFTVDVVMVNKEFHSKSSSQLICSGYLHG